MSRGRQPRSEKAALRWIVVLLALACLTCSTAAARRSAVVNGLADAAAQQPLITYCELASFPEKYLGKAVRVIGIFRVGFEWQQLYSPRCPDVGTTWLEWASSHACRDSPQAKVEAQAKAAPQDVVEEKSGSLETDGGTFGLVARGTLLGMHGSFGHLGAYANEFHAVFIERFELLDEASYQQHALTDQMRSEIERFEAEYGPQPAAPPS